MDIDVFQPLVQHANSWQEVSPFNKNAESIPFKYNKDAFDHRKVGDVIRVVFQQKVFAFHIVGM